MQINVSIDAGNLRARTLREQKNLAYSTSQAINATARDIQQAQRMRMDRIFHLRRTGFMYRMVKIFRFSNVRQGIPYAEVGIDRKPRLLLGLFESGGKREPFKGKSVAVPITGAAARPSPRSMIPEALTFQKMRLKRYRTKAGRVQWKGQGGTFLIPGAGVFRRTGGIARLLYKLISPGAMRRLPASLRFVRIARESMKRFSVHFHKFFSYRK